jgi:WD40 repeat protein
MVWIDDLDRADEPVPIQFDGEIVSLTVSPEGRWLAVGVRDEGAVLVDISTVEMPQIPLEYHTDDVTDMAFSPDGRGLAVASQDTKVSIWDPEDPEAPMAVLEEHTKVASSVSFSGDSRWLATGSWDGTVLIWDTNDLSASAMTLGPAGRVEDVALRHDGAVLASAGGGAVLLWDLTTGDPTDQVANPTVLTAGPRSASRITFSPDGRWLATAGSGGDVGLWMQLDDLMESACHSVGRNLTLEEWQSLMPGEPYHETCEQWPDGG